MVLRVGIVFICLLSLSGCASRKQVIIDPAGVDMAQFDSDLAECKAVSEQVEQGAGKGAVVGAVVGGLIGAALGNSDTAQRAAGAGAVSGGAHGAGRTQQEKNTVVKNCMRNRGYRVLN